MTMKMNEAKPKGAVERIHRKLRISGNKQKKRKVKSSITALGQKDLNKVIPRRRGMNNDPTRNNPWVSEACEFILKNKLNPSRFEGLDENVKSVLLPIVDHMIAIQMGGWEDDGICLVNEAGQIARKDNWDLLEDGSLALKSGVIIDGDVDNLYEIRLKLDA